MKNNYHYKLTKKILLNPLYGFTLFNKICSIYKEKYLRKNWIKETPNSKNEHENIAIVIVNYNTIDLLTLLLFSIFKNLGVKRISKIVIVDNNSLDGSKELLKELENQKLISLICNRKQKYHGPALNQGIKYLQNHAKEIENQYKYIWILDSDVVVLKQNTINDALLFISAQKAAVKGQFQYDNSELGDPHVSSIILDPLLVWKRNIFPFINHGFPPKLFYKSIRKKGIKICDFPFRSQNYLLHFGEGTLKQIFEDNLSENQYSEWASIHHNYHFHGNPKGSQINDEVNKLMIKTIGKLTVENISKVFSAKNSMSDDFKLILEKLEIS